MFSGVSLRCSESLKEAACVLRQVCVCSYSAKFSLMLSVFYSAWYRKVSSWVCFILKGCSHFERETLSQVKHVSPGGTDGTEVVPHLCKNRFCLHPIFRHAKHCLRFRFCLNVRVERCFIIIWQHRRKIVCLWKSRIAWLELYIHHSRAGKKKKKLGWTCSLFIHPHVSVFCVGGG